MKQNDFNRIVTDRLEAVRKLLIQKGDEYSHDFEDRLLNFKKGAQLQHCTQKQCLQGYVTKHIIAIYDFIEQDALGTEILAMQWAEKIGDIIAYMILLEAMVVEDLLQPQEPV